MSIVVMELVLATGNMHKLREFSQLIKPHTLVPMPAGVSLPPEKGATFSENAIAKARAAAQATGKPAIADDSGIEVAALGGLPGVRSARYAGEGASDRDNLEKLLAESSGLVDRSCAYVCALALAQPAGGCELFEARCEGMLADGPRGEGGFGYDPVFIPNDVEGGQTMAEMGQKQKDSISHRGRAASMLLARLEAGGG